MKEYTRTRPAVTQVATFLLCLLTYAARPALIYWDPQGLTGSNPYTNDLSGFWEAPSWSTNNTGQAVPQLWSENNAAVFGIHTGLGTPPFTVTMLSNHVIAGIFVGSLAPNACDVTITGNGVWTIPTPLQGFNAHNAGDGSLAFIRINVVLTGPGTLTAEGNGQIFLGATNTYTGGTQLGFQLGAINNFTGILNFSNGGAFGTGPIAVYSSGGTLAVQGASAITVTNDFNFIATNPTPVLNLVGNPSGLTLSGNWNLGTNTPSIGSTNVPSNLVIISGGISGPGGLTKTNLGTLKLGGTNTYTGPTTVSEGTLALASANPIGASTVTVASAAALSNATATACAVGGSLTLSAGAKAGFTAFSAVGKISVTGDLALNANNITVNLTGPALAPGSYRLLDFTGTLSGSANSTPTLAGTPLPGGYGATIATVTGSGGHVDLLILPPAPVFGSIAMLPDNSAQFSFSTLPGVTYSIEASSSETGPFAVLAAPVAAGTLQVFNDSGASSYPSRFYRVMVAGSNPAIYSLNQVGFVRIGAGAGQSLVYNPFYTVQLQGAMPSPPNTTEVFFPTSNDPTNDCFFDAGSGAWLDFNLDPAGAIIIPALTNFYLFTPVAFNFALAGEVAGTPGALAPNIAAPPQGQLVAAGQTATFSVNASGDSPLAYQWLFNGLPIAGATGSSLSIPAAQAANAGGYEVVVSNAYGSVNSASVALTVATPPVSRNVAVGGRATFLANVVGVGGFSYQWSFNSNPIIGASNSSLVLTNLRTTNAGVYTLTVANPDGVANVSATLSVTAGSLILYPTNLVVVRIGEGTQPLLLSGSTGNSLFLDQFTTAGAYVNTVSIPDSGPTAVVASGNAFEDSYLSRSLDGRLLSLAAYGTNISSGVDVVTSNIPRVVVTYDGAAAYNRPVVTTSYAGVSWRSVTTDGTNNFWGAGSSGGTVYLGNNGPSAVVQNAKPNCRVVQVLNGNLYMASASQGADLKTGIYKFNGLPQTAVGLPVPIASFNAQSNVCDFAINPAGTILYWADDRGGGIQRWNFDTLQGVWTNAYALTNGLTATPQGSAWTMRDLALDWSGANPVLYTTTQETSQNRLLRVTDTGAGSTFSILATAGPNQIFRGVKFGPVPNGTVSSASPWAYLKFDESSGTTAVDSTGNGWNGTLVNGPVFTSGFSNNAVSLNGSSQYVSLPAGVVNGLTDFSVACWVRLNSIATWARIFDFGNNTTVNMFLTPQSSAGAVRFAITTGGSGAEQIINGTSPLSAGVWHHVAVTRSGTIGTLYVDGSPVGTNPGMTLNPSSLGSTTQNWIGRSQYSADPYLNGLVDDFRIYNGALSTSEVQALVTVVAPIIVTQPQSVAVVAGSNATFSAVVIGTSPLAYQWQSNGVNLSDGARMSGSHSNVLTIAATQLSDEGGYRLVVSNFAGPVTSATAALTVLSAGAAFAPIPLTSSSYTRDLVVEKTASAPLSPGGLTTATMDNGIANINATWYERGFDLAAPATGLPPAGSLITNLTLPDHHYRLPPSYVASNNVLMIDAANNPSGNLALSSPVTCAALSFLGSAGSAIGQPLLVGYTVRHSDGTQESGIIPCFDYFVFNAGILSNNVSVAFAANGRVNAQTYAFDSVNLTNPVLYSIDVSLANTNSAITNISLYYSSGFTTSHATIFAVSAAPFAGAPFDALPITGYNQDVVAEASSAPGVLTGVTTASMDAGAANTGNTWYEQAYNPASPSSGLPPAGSTFTNASAPDRAYVLAPSYTANNGVLLNSSIQTATITPLTLKPYSALSILHSTAFGSTPATIRCVVNHLDGTAETNTFASPDWFNNVPYAWSANGRINLNNRVLNNVGTTNPRLYSADFSLANTNSPISSIALTRLGGLANSQTAVFAVSGIPSPGPQLTSQPTNQLRSQGDIATFSVSATGSGPLTYQWRLNGNPLPGMTGTTLRLVGVTDAQAGRYDVIVSSPYGIALSQTALLVVGPGQLTTLWSAAPGSRPYLTTNNTERGLAYDPLSGHLALVSRALGTNRVYILDAQTGADLYTLNNGSNGLSGGFFLLNLIGAADDGALYACNLTLDSSSSPFKVYRWADDGPATQPTVAYFGDPSPGNPQRYGDTLAVRGSGTNTQILLGSRNGTNVVLLTTTDGLNFAPPSINVDGVAPGNFGLGLAFGASNTFWGKSYNLPLCQCAFDPQAATGTVVQAFGGGQFPLDVAPIGISPGLNWMAGIPVIEASHSVQLYALPASGAPILVSSNLFPTSNANVNGTGAVAFSGDTLYALDSNNGLLAARVQPVPAPPTLSQQPENQAVGFGSSATFSVTALGAQSLTYQWRFNGATLSGATSSSLVIPSAFLGNAGYYDVLVTNFYGAVTSTVATLTLYTPPTILQQPADVQIAVGDSAVFRVVASSSAPLSYQWFLNGTNVAGATGSSYTITNAQMPDAGVYNAVVISPAGSLVSSNANLFVSPPPPPPAPLPSYTIDVRAGLNLIANQVNRGGNTLNEIMPTVPNGTVVSKYENASSNWLQSTYSASLGAWVPGNITLSPGEGAFLDSPINFSLTLTGQPNTPALPVAVPVGFAYLLSRQTNGVGTYENIVGADPVFGAALYKWINSNATYAVFSYTATGWSGGVGPVVEVGESVWIAPNGGAPVPLPEAPSITNQPVSVTTAFGGTALFTVGARGSQPLAYQWRLNGNQISGATNSSLALTNVQPGNIGNYSVAINNSIGVTNSVEVSLSLSNIVLLPFADNFSSAGDLGSTTNGSGFGSNVGATLEPGENAPLNLVVGSSVWVKWQPQAGGIANFNTVGSGFDTVLAVYTGSSVSSLALVAGDDDSAPFLCSTLSFNAVAGTTYFLQVSGFGETTGTIELSWNEVVTVHQAPVILSQPSSQTVPPGTNVTLSVGVEGVGPFAYQWFLDNQPLLGATNTSLTLSNIDISQVGFYTVQITNPQTLDTTTSQAAHVSILVTGPGFVGNAAFVSGQDKFQSATALTPPDPNVAHDPAPCGGFTGAISDGNALASAQPGEPSHCGYTPCHSVWYSYVSPASGPLTIRLSGNNFNAVLAAYTGPGNSFTTLAPVACSANHGAAGESVTYSATSGATNWIVVDGINCGSGNYSLGWTMAAAPAVSAQPVSQTLTRGTPFSLVIGAAGAPSLGYQWRLNGANLAGATSSSYAAPSFQDTNAGSYTVVVTNAYGSVTSLTATASMAVGAPVAISASAVPAAGARYIVGGGSYASGQNVTLTAVPNDCYSFVNWLDANGAIVGTSPNLTFAASANRPLTANFTFNTYSISATASPSAGGPVSGARNYNCGDSVTLTATPSFGYLFASWTEGIVTASTSAAYTFTANGNRTLTANFSPVVTLLPSPAIGGSISYSVVQTRVTISAQPATGWKFKAWSDGSPLNPRNITATAGASFTASFVPATISLGIASPALNGNGPNLSLTGPTGTSYRIDVSTDLLNWTPLTSFTATTSPMPFTDRAALGQTQRFYRALWLGP